MSVCLERTEHSIFYQRPSNSLLINEDLRTQYASDHTIQTLMNDLQVGPLVGLGPFGPNAYKTKPIKLKVQVHQQDVYCWKKGTKRVEDSPNIYFMILGAKIIKEKGYVYLTPSKDLTADPKVYLRKHQACRDSEIYVISHKTFKNYYHDLYCLAQTKETIKKKEPSEEKSSVSTLKKIAALSILSDDDYVQQLSKFELDSILDRGIVEAACKKIGEEIFQKYKAKAGGNGDAGIAAMQRICDATHRKLSDGKLRHQYISRVWNGIGDGDNIWMA